MGRVFWFAQRVVFCAATVLMVTGTCVRDMSAQDALQTPAPSAPHVGVPEDWSTSHVIYTRSGATEDMMKVLDDPRFLNNVLQHYPRENGRLRGQSATAGSTEDKSTENSLLEESSDAVAEPLLPRLPRDPIRPKRPFRHGRSHVDWALPLGSTGGMAAGQSPAKYSFDPNANPNCATDFAVYTINAAGSVGSQANLVGVNNLYVNGGTTGYCYTNSGTSYPLTQVIVNTAQSLTLTKVATSVGATAVYTGAITGGAGNAYAGFVFVVTGFTTLNNAGTFFCTASTATTLTLLNSAAVAQTHAGNAASTAAYTTYLSTSTAATWVGVTTAITGFTNAGNNVTVTPGTLLDPGYGFAVATGSQVNETHAGTITFEYEAPTFLFSYAIQTHASALSPVLSLDGTKVAWIDTASPAMLHITKWKAGEGTNATTGSVAIDLENAPCLAGNSCDFTVNFTNTTTAGCTANAAIDSNSNLYVDYPSDNGYIAANNGVLYQISGIFRGNPALTFCTTFTSTLNFGGTNIGSPVYDALNNTVYVSDAVKLYAYTVGATSFTAASPASYTYGNTGLSSTGPVLDAFGGFIYAFSNNDNQTGNKTSVTQIKTTLASGVNVNLGPQFGSDLVPLYYGTFDNNYYTYGAAYGSNPASTLYSCGTDSTKTYNQDLFAVSFNSSTGLANTAAVMTNNYNVNGNAAAGVSQATAVTCSPLSEFYDGTHDRLFVGSGTVGAATGPNLVQMWNINTQLTNTSGTGGTLPTYAVEDTGYLGGTSGITMDNISAVVGAESIYFGTGSANSTTVTASGTAYNVNGIYTNSTNFLNTQGMDYGGNAYSSNLLGLTRTWNGTTFTFGAANAVDAWANVTITLPSGSFGSLEILAAAVNGNQIGQTFTVNYTDGTTSTFTQSLSDWYYGTQGYPGESVAVTMAYENTYTGGERVHTTYIYGYVFNLNASKTVKSLTLPVNANVVVLAAALGSSCGANNYCAVKLTQGSLL
ncbi:MAG TPA: hypothetical protein VKH18_06715 [Terriglobales bacterium]|nr:hypothetical protein [Terriglobales bacterium]